MANISDSDHMESYLKHGYEEKGAVTTESPSVPSTPPTDIVAGDVDIIAIPDTYVTTDGSASPTRSRFSPAPRRTESSRSTSRYARVR